MAKTIVTILQGEKRKKESKRYRLQREVERLDEEIAELDKEIYEKSR